MAVVQETRSIRKDLPAEWKMEPAGSLPCLDELKPPRSGRLLANLLVLLLLALVLFLTYAPWMQNVKGSGRAVALTPNDRQQTIGAPVDGRLMSWSVIEGSRVKKGDKIAQIADNDPEILNRLSLEKEAVQARIGEANNRAVSLQASIGQLELSRRNALEAGRNRIQSAKEALKAAEEALVGQDFALTAAKQNIDRQQELLRRGLTSVRAVEVATQEYGRAQVEVNRARNTMAAAKAEVAARSADQEKIETDFQNSLANARAGVAAAKVEVANANVSMQQTNVRIARQETQEIVAPRDGTILRLLAQPGSEMLKAGQAIAQFVPDGQKLVVELWMDGNDTPLIHKGDKARLQFEGWPAIQWVGWPSVAVGTFGGQVLLVDSTDDGKGKFRILVEPDPTDREWPSKTYLRQGVRANGWVLLREVSVGFEIWRQFNGFPPVIASTEPGMAESKDKK
jgi:membrane fusion protein, adhesin transport system